MANAKEKPVCDTGVEIMVDVPKGDIYFEAISDSIVRMTVRNPLNEGLVAQAVVDLPLKSGVTIKALDSGLQVTAANGKTFILSATTYGSDMPKMIDHNGQIDLVTSDEGDIGFKCNLAWKYTIAKVKDLPQLTKSSKAYSVYPGGDYYPTSSLRSMPVVTTSKLRGFMWQQSDLLVTTIDKKETIKRVSQCVQRWQVFQTENPVLPAIPPHASN